MNDAPIAPRAQAPARSHRLRDGTVVVTRPIEPTDADALQWFHDHLSDESIRRRFFNLHRRLSPTEVHRFTEVDHREREAYVAEVEGELIGVGRYDGRADSSRAEVAFVVADAWQGHGVGTVLLQRLAEHASSVGIDVFTAEVLADNRAMIDVFEHACAATSSTIEGGVVCLTMPIAGIHDVTAEISGFTS
jgi:RimJ/RimL family protein N-acetyltransferase